MLTAIPTLIIVTVMVFAIQRLLPGDPALILAGEDKDLASNGLYQGLNIVSMTPYPCSILLG
ncbi:MAG: hypothetical protein R2865_02505 [Deinococcales bacterium]